MEELHFWSRKSDISDLLKNNLRIWMPEEFELSPKHSVGKKPIFQNNLELIVGSTDSYFYSSCYPSCVVIPWDQFFIYRAVVDYIPQRKSDIVHPFISLNSESRRHRSTFIDYLSSEEILSKCVVSYIHPDPTFEWQSYSGEPLILDTQNPNSSQFSLPDSYSKSYIQVVLESSFSAYFVTEKTIIPLLLSKPFLPFGPPGYVSFLEMQYGIEPYTEIIDYSYDSVINWKSRLFTIVKFLKEMIETKSYVSKYPDSVIQKLKRNRERVLDYISTVKLPKHLLASEIFLKHYKPLITKAEKKLNTIR